MKIGGIKAESGKRSRGILTIGPYFYHKRAYIRKNIRLPFTVINGAHNGPVLCVTGGVHPTEYAGIAAAIKLSNEIEPSNLKGALIIVPVVNLPGYEERTYICPIDGVNFNSIFPGKAEGTIGYKIVYKITNEFIKKSDYYVDLHGGDIQESMLCHIFFYRTGNAELDSKTEALARAFGFKYISPKEPEKTRGGSSFKAAAENGIPACLCECNQGGKLLQAEASKVFEGLLNVMRHLKMIEGEPKKIEDQEVVNYEWVIPKHGGLFHYPPRPGDFFKEGEVIGELKDLYGNVVETLRSPCTGKVFFMIHNPVIEPGERLLQIMYRVEE